MNTLKVYLWNTEIGRLVYDDKQRNTYFMFNSEFLKQNLDIAPIVASVNNVRRHMPFWGEEEKIYQKLPAFLSDSLPDSWGNQLFDCWCRENGLSRRDITPLDKLAFIGKRGLGALEFIPEKPIGVSSGKVNIGELALLADKIYIQRENAKILPDESITLQSLISVGTSAGGRRPKAIVAINNTSGEIRSGQISGLSGFDYYIIKFGDIKYCSAELEMTYYEMAIKSGIRMMESSLV